ncbi:MAG: sel1 repeat family protein [Rikenellaceae bacterium]|nr:sel1 repeat family protein [Rikenellaceae bacterium]
MRNGLRIWVLTFVLLMLPMSILLAANPYPSDVEVEAYRRGAAKGSALMTHRLGKCYARGYSVERNYAEAVRLYTIASEMGYLPAKNDLASHLEQGLGTTADPLRAAALYREAAEWGYAFAQYNLGRLYSKGIGVTQSDQQAAYWFKRAADQKVGIAIFCLGECYWFGRGVPENHHTALRLWREAAEQEIPQAMFNLGLYYDQTATNDAELTTAASFYRDAAMAKYHEAEYRLGCLYRDGRGVRRDMQLAEYWFLLAAESDLLAAKQALVDLYKEVGLESKAEYWSQRAEESSKQ